MEPNAAPAKIMQQLHEALAAGVVISPQAIRLLLVSLLCRGHVLLEDVPGVGKTQLLKRLSALVNVPCKRVQGTADMLPSDLIGVNLLDAKAELVRFMPGPVFTSFLLVDELNRLSPRSQAALLEAMAENAVSHERKTRPLPESFWVMASQNPQDFVGTFPLPESQLDRFFMRISLGYPSLAEEVRLLQMGLQRPEAPLPVINEESLLKLQSLVTRVRVDGKILDYIARLAQASREHPRVRWGASPRAGLALVKASQALALIQGQGFVTPPMVLEMLKPLWAHRLILRHLGERPELVLEDIAQAVAQPTLPRDPTP
jgi:MoxR-like ATPase